MRSGAHPQEGPLKVTHLLVNLDWGGAERLLVDALPRLRSRGLDVEVVALGKDGGAGKEMRQKGIKVTVLNGTPRNPAFLIPLIKHLQSRRPYILHAHLFWPGVFGRIVGRLLGIPCVVTHEHNLPDNMSGSRLMIESFTYRWTHAVIGVSKPVIERRKKYIKYGTKVIVINNGMDFSFLSEGDKESLRTELKIENARFVAGWVGRMEEEWKSLAVLVEAAAILKESLDGVVWVLIGGGPDEETIKKRVEELGLEKDFVFTGVRSDARRFYKAMDVFVLSSKSEGSPLVIVEAMGAGTPVVATDVGGIPEIIQNGQNGILVPHGDPKAMAMEVESVLKNAELGKKLTENARDYVEDKFNIEYFSDKIIEFYNELTT